MLRKCNIKSNRVALMTLGLLASVGVGLLSSEETHATECTADSPYSCVSVTFGNLSGETTASPGKTTKSQLYFSMPVSVTMSQVKSYSISVYDSNNGALKSAGGTIPSVTTATSWKQLADNGSAWGMRWTAGKNDDGTQNFQPIPTASKQASLAKDVAVNSRGASSADYTLGFGVVVDGNTAAGDYTDTLTVAVVAKPRDVTIFDITRMQDMTADICAATTTPSASAENTDTDGSHAGDPNYVPETTLVDTRGGGIDGSGRYLIRKLADGNCWMSQNLELNILGNGQSVTNYKTSTAAADDNNTTVTADNYFGTTVADGLVFTANDTDLHSTSIWTPDYFKKTYVDSGNAPYAKVYTTMSSTLTGTNKEYGWANNGMDGMRSYSFAASNPAWNYSTEASASSKDGNGNYTFTDAATGQPYARRGNLYNWTAATLGSSLKTNADGQKAEDSICPRGWQLPDNSGDHSFVNLLTTTYGMAAGNNVASFNKLNEWPLQFLRTGNYHRSYGYLNERTTDGYWWSSTAGSATSGHSLHSWTGVVYPQSNNWRGFGFAVRCVAR